MNATSRYEMAEHAEHAHMRPLSTDASRDKLMRDAATAAIVVRDATPEEFNDAEAAAGRQLTYIWEQ